MRSIILCKKVKKNYLIKTKGQLKNAHLKPDIPFFYNFLLEVENVKNIGHVQSIY